MATVIDADTHIIESPSMWQHFDAALHPRRPLLLTVPGDTAYRGRNAFWLIDGNIFPKPAGKGGFRLATPSAADFQISRTDISIPCREITDPEARLRDMDGLGVGTQVVYPTLFLVYLTDDLEMEIALCRAYNRFLAEAWARTNNRIRWVVVPPLRSIDASIQELRFGREHGATGVFFRGIERDRTLDDPYFFPIYEEASRLDLPICIHTAAGCPAFTNVFNLERNDTFAFIRLLPLIAFRDIVANRIPEQFPRLRFGFIEAAASWVPYLCHTLRRSLREDRAGWGPRLFEDYRLYIACEVDEDIPYLLRFIGEDHLITGSDYGHTDPSTERELVATLRRREDLPGRVVDKILDDNARSFYNL